MKENIPRSGQVTIAAFRRQQPEVTFTLSEAPAAPLLAAVIGGRVDVGITVEPAPDRRVRYTHLFDDPFVLVCQRGDPLASRSVVPWSVFAERPFVASASLGITALPRLALQQMQR